MPTFDELVASRRQWIDDVLKPWCLRASRKELLLAEQEWPNLAGKVAPEMTLWLWAWSRFPVLTVAGMTTINETMPVTLTTKEGIQLTGIPDARESKAGELILVTHEGESLDAIPIDEIESIER